jgi:ABC-type nitrate/sulfonate/bicarbonate transport system ATPase subunit
MEEMKMTTAKPKVHVNVAHTFGSLMVLDHVQFDVYENEFLCILGPSGSGKTTMANLVAGLLKPSFGTVKIDGELVNPQTHNISYVFQARSCLPWRTVKDNVKIGLEIKGISGPVADKRVSDVLQIVGLKGFEDYYPNQISGGMKQRVAIARAFCVESDILILDEPFGSLDAQTRYVMQLEVLKICEKMKRTVIFITNNIEEAVLLADRLLVFSDAPARMIKEITVDLLKPRKVTNPDFLEIRRSINDLSRMSQDAIGGVT